MSTTHRLKGEPHYRFSLEPLARLAAERYRPRDNNNGYESVGDVGRIHALTGIDQSIIYRWRHSGISLIAADRLAVALGMHPAMIWPEWFAIDSDDAAPHLRLVEDVA